jgi:acetyl esterase/lipase
VAGAVSGGCAGADPNCELTLPESTGAHFVATENYRPGVPADIYLPDQSEPAATLVLLPGGAWQTADRSGLAPLAERWRARVSR